MEKMFMDVVIIGGSAAGLVSAMTAKCSEPNKEVMVIRQEEKVMIPCGIPYIFGSLESSNQNILPDGGLENLGVHIKVDTVTDIHTTDKFVTTLKGDQIQYSKLIIATGSKPFIPDFIEGVNLENVFTVPKSKEYLDHFKQQIQGLKKIAVIGAGFIGVEVSDELNKAGFDVTLIELQDTILGAAFDDDTSNIAQEILVDRGVTVQTGKRLTKIHGDQKVSAIEFEQGETLEVDAVILSMGYLPNTELAKKAGISVNKYGFIKVDTYMRTHTQDVFACGDCAQKRDFVTNKLTPIMLASTACAEARVAAMNLFELSTIKTFNGTIGIYSTNIGDTSFGVAGVTEVQAQKEGMKIITGSFKGIDRHPGKLNNPHYQMVKLVVSANSGLILGGQVIGGVSTGELTNVLGFIIQNKMTINDILISQIGTQPMLTASPAGYPLIKAAEIVCRKMHN